MDDKGIKLNMLDALIKLVDSRVEKKLALHAGNSAKSGPTQQQKQPQSSPQEEQQQQQKKRSRNPPVTPADFECQGNKITNTPCPRETEENFQAGHPTKIKDPVTNKITTYQTCKACKRGVDRARAKSRSTKKPKVLPAEEERDEEEEEEQQQEEEDEE